MGPCQEFGRWLKDALNNPDFKRVQLGLGNQGVEQSRHPNIPAASSSIISPINPEKQEEPDICSFRIISRPR